jgi:hypothetical protein
MQVNHHLYVYHYYATVQKVDGGMEQNVVYYLFYSSSRTIDQNFLMNFKVQQKVDGEACSLNDQCLIKNGLYCSSNICSCHENFYWTRSKCGKLNFCYE